MLESFRRSAASASSEESFRCLLVARLRLATHALRSLPGISAMTHLFQFAANWRRRLIGSNLTLWMGGDSHPHCSMVAAGVPADHFQSQIAKTPSKSPPSKGRFRWILNG